MTIDHPGFTPAAFDAAVRKAMDEELCIQRTGRASVVAVSSSQDPDLSYLVSRRECSCAAGQRYGRCKQCAMAIAFWDVWSKVELGGAQSGEPSQSA